MCFSQPCITQVCVSFCAFRREDELLAENKELAAALAAAEVLASSGPSSGGNATHLAAMEVELESHIRREAAAAAGACVSRVQARSSAYPHTHTLLSFSAASTRSPFCCSPLLSVLVMHTTALYATQLFQVTH